MLVIASDALVVSAILLVLLLLLPLVVLVLPRANRMFGHEKEREREGERLCPQLHEGGS